MPPPYDEVTERRALDRLAADIYEAGTSDLAILEAAETLERSARTLRDGSFKDRVSASIMLSVADDLRSLLQVGRP